jgi:hypothetical protein
MPPWSFSKGNHAKIISIYHKENKRENTFFHLWRYLPGMARERHHAVVSQFPPSGFSRKDVNIF